MVEDAAPILLLAVVAVVVATLVIGAALSQFATACPIVACLMLGSIVATTDPVAVIGIFHDVGAPSRLSRLVEGESLLNDAAAITLFGLLLEILVAPPCADPGAASLSFVAQLRRRYRRRLRRRPPDRRACCRGCTTCGWRR